jgi:hypothetical protein
MTTNFPGGIDTFPRPVATDPLSNPAHAKLHTDVSDAVVAIQQDIGPTGATNPATVRGALLGKADIGHTHNYAPLVHGHAITDVTGLRPELDALRNDIDATAPSPLTTKGDLYGFDTDVARIPVGLPGQILGVDPAAPYGVRWRDEIISPVGGITLTYQFDSGLTPNPTTGEYRINNAAPASATTLYVNATTQPGNDASVIWDGLDIGDYVTMWRTAGGAGSQAFRLTSKPVASGAGAAKFYTAGIAVVGTPTGSIPNNAAVAINTITTPAATLPAGGNQGQALVKQSGADYDVAWSTGQWVLRAGDTMTGPLTLASRLFGNFSGALPGRTYLQTNVPNEVTAVGALPNGTNTTALLQAFNGSDPANSANIQLRANSNNVTINSTFSGTGTLVPLSFQMNNTERGRLNTDGSWTFLGPVTAPSYIGAGYAANHAAGTWAFLSNEVGAASSRGGVWADGPDAIRLVTASFAAGIRLNGPAGQVLVDANFHAPNLFGIASANSADANTFQGALRGGWSGASGANAPYAFASILNLPGLGGRDMQLGWFTGVDTASPQSPSFRTFNDGGSWNPWRTFWHSGNFTPQGPQVNNVTPGNNLDMSWQGNGNIGLAVDASFFVLWSTGNLDPVTRTTPQTITGGKIFESQTTDGTGDLRVTRAVDAKSGAILFGDDNEAFLFRVNDATDFLNISCELVMGGRVRPGNNAAVDALGSASNRWSQLYAASGTINTSDAREKTPLESLTAAEIGAAKEIAKSIGTYKWLAMVKEKGDGARKHVGVTAQEVIRIMESHGLDAMAYGLVCYDEWEASEVQEPFTGEDMALRTRKIEAGDRYGVRYDELAMFIAAGFEARLSALESA